MDLQAIQVALKEKKIAIDNIARVGSTLVGEPSEHEHVGKLNQQWVALHSKVGSLLVTFSSVQRVWLLFSMYYVHWFTMIYVSIAQRILTGGTQLINVSVARRVLRHD